MDHHRLIHLYNAVARKWGRDAPKLRDDLISHEIVLGLVREEAPETVLDIGCGDGNMCRAVAPYTNQVVGVDLSEAMLEEARSRSQTWKNISYVHADFETLATEFSAGSFSLCLALFAVCCAESAETLNTLFRGIAAVLRANGRAIIQIPHPSDSFFRERSEWFRDVDRLDDYFAEAALVKRELRTTEDEWLLVGRYHYPLSIYVNAMIRAGLTIDRVIEPKASPEVVDRWPDLAREARLPSSMIFVANTMGDGKRG